MTVPIAVVVHKVDTARHKTIPPGWRWCVYIGEAPWDNHARMLNAGWCPNGTEASVEGEAVGIAVVKALRMFGHDIEYRIVELDHDPIRAEV